MPYEVEYTVHNGDQSCSRGQPKTIGVVINATVAHTASPYFTELSSLCNHNFTIRLPTIEHSYGIFTWNRYTMSTIISVTCTLLGKNIASKLAPENIISSKSGRQNNINIVAFSSGRRRAMSWPGLEMLIPVTLLPFSQWRRILRSLDTLPKCIFINGMLYEQI